MRMASAKTSGQERSQAYKYGTLSLLYFVQGAPYGFQTGCLPLLLRQSGLSFSSLGAMKLLFVPWVCKPLYAPVIERIQTKQWWMMTSILVLGLTCLMASLTSLETMSPILLVLLLLNAASAIQDICVDSLAIEILEPGELGAGNMIQVVAYKAGSVFAGAALLWVKEASSWRLMWIIFGSLYIICLGLIWGLGLGYSGDRKENEKKQPVDDGYEGLSLEFLVANWQRMISVPGTVWMVTFVMFYKLCERGEGTIPIYLVDKGVSVSSLAFWTGVVRSVASIGGSAVSGFLLSSESGRVKASELMLRTACLRIIPITFQFIIILCWGREPVTDLGGLNTDTVLYYLSILCLVLANFCAGLMTTACFTTMMSLSQSVPTCLQSSHYSLLSTMEVLGKLMFASVAGILIDLAGLEMVFILFVTFSILTVPLLVKMPDFDKIKPFCDTN